MTLRHIDIYCSPAQAFNPSVREWKLFLQINPLYPKNNNSLWQQTICLNFCSKGFESDYRASLSQTIKESKTCAETKQQEIYKQYENVLSSATFKQPFTCLLNILLIGGCPLRATGTHPSLNTISHRNSLENGCRVCLCANLTTRPPYPTSPCLFHKHFLGTMFLITILPIILDLFKNFKRCSNQQYGHRAWALFCSQYYCLPTLSSAVWQQSIDVYLALILST